MALKKLVEQQKKFLLVGCDTVKERDAMSELWHVLVKYCQIEPIDVFELPIRGLFLVAIEANPISVNLKIKQIIDEKKFHLKYCRKITPIELLTTSSVENLMKNVPPLMQRVPVEAKWRIVVNRRHTRLKRNEVISLIASHPLAPKGKVDLENPNWYVLVEIFGEWLGIGVYNTDPIVTIAENFY